MSLYAITARYQVIIYYMFAISYNFFGLSITLFLIRIVGI